MAEQPTTPPGPGLLDRWQRVVLAVGLGLPVTLATAFAGFFFLNPVGGPTAELDSWGTAAWATSAVALAGPATVVPGPRRVLRVVVGPAVGLAWFVAGRYLLLQR